MFSSAEYELTANKDKDKELTFVYEDGTIEKGTGAPFYRMIYGQGRPNQVQMVQCLEMISGIIQHY